MHMLRYNTLQFLFVLTSLVAGAQLKYYAEPLKIPVSLSGNFGELRSDHFHMGLDFRTERRTGIPVHASAEGFVSRIAVSPGGYGLALYVDHPNNTTTVYGHLLKFRKDIEEYVKAEQYKRHSFSVDLSLLPGVFPVQRMEMIGYSGNSGSSGGPHLHYEIRNTPTQDALNPLHINNFTVADQTAPRIASVQFYPLDNQSHVEGTNFRKRYTPVAAGGRYTLSQDKAVRAFGRIGIAVKANDFFDGNQSPCGIFSARLLIEKQEVFSFTLGRIPYSLNRYLNSHIDYEEYIENNERFHKLWLDPGNRLNVYNTDSQRGILQIDSGKIYRGEIILSDVKGNTSRFNFRINGDFVPVAPLQPMPENLFMMEAPNEYLQPGFELRTPSGAFYEDFDFQYRSFEDSSAFFSPVHQVHQSTTPVHKSLQMKIKTDLLPDSLTQKAIVVSLDESGKMRYAGGKYREGWMETSIRNFGNYAVGVDTIPPEIVPLTLKNNALTEAGEIRFRITDELSGISGYRGMINGEWVLFEYDPKYSRLTYRIDTGRIGSGKRHTLELKVTDQVNNESVFHATFWK
jgi:murein DD-endopeptidase MepM/ murein hydrolase activator NlpD